MYECPFCLYAAHDPCADGCSDCGMSVASSPEVAFAGELRRLTRGWPRPPDDLRIEPSQGGHPIIAWLDMCDADENVALLTIGVHVSGDSLRGDQLHNQLLSLPERPTALAVTASGTPERLAEAAGRWFSSILTRPVTRHEWIAQDPHVQWRALFADSDTALAQSRDCPPHGTPSHRAVPVHVCY